MILVLPPEQPCGEPIERELSAEASVQLAGDLIQAGLALKFGVDVEARIKENPDLSNWT